MGKTALMMVLAHLSAFLLFLSVLLITESETLATCLPAVVMVGAWYVTPAAGKRRLDELPPVYRRSNLREVTSSHCVGSGEWYATV